MPIAQDQVWPPDTASKESLGPQTPGLNWSQPQLSLLLGALTPPSMGRAPTAGSWEIHLLEPSNAESR